MRYIVENISVLGSNEFHYKGWPTVHRLRNGHLILVYSGGRQRHICPFGRIEMMMSQDEGMTWSWPRIVLDTVFDDRDAGFVETICGSLLISSFSSNAYRRILNNASSPIKGLSAQQVENWFLADRRSEPFGDHALGQWVIRSTDHGQTWSGPIETIVNSPHGPTVLKNGELLYAGKEIHRRSQLNPRIGLCRSDDDGQSWYWFSTIPSREGDDPAHYHELHMVEAANGDLIVHIRNENEANADEILQTISTDGGNTWGIPHPIGVWGLPSHLLRLNDGRLMMSYGYRREPFGNQARVSDDHGRSWSDPIVISEDGTCTDLGYPSTVQLGNDCFLTIWYERNVEDHHAFLRQAIWRLL